jgi:hypothetical protein
MLRRPTQLRLWLHFLGNTPTIVATMVAALATVIVVLVLQAAEASKVAVVAAGVVAFLAVWEMLFPTPPEAPWCICLFVPFGASLPDPDR